MLLRGRRPEGAPERGEWWWWWWGGGGGAAPAVSAQVTWPSDGIEWGGREDWRQE